MAVNVVYNLYSGGMRPQNETYAMLPSGSSTGTGANAVTGYADHQRRRSYQVVRQMQMTPLKPYGGLYTASNNDQKDWEWYSNVLVAGGDNVVVDDVWKLIIIPPNTRLEWIAAQVFTGVTGLVFDVFQVDAAGVEIGTEKISNIGAAASGPTLQEITGADRFSASIRYLAIHFDTVPGASGVAKLQGLDFAIQAEVVDWGSYDLNGNA